MKFIIKTIQNTFIVLKVFFHEISFFFWFNFLLKIILYSFVIDKVLKILAKIEIIIIPSFLMIFFSEIAEVVNYNFIILTSIIMELWSFYSESNSTSLENSILKKELEELLEKNNI